ncbi:hypothetical protein AC578_9849 [Pseudocercospora eumusae]|uniref:Uncharacterized protein n=1 Tax=Pseudocercospora eumusae TaxID=321146 RepID=A0A139HB49_9PEZI|nr:hypothetical protein AC578_9849 [Pseudocercospora eumusae]
MEKDVIVEAAQAPGEHGGMVARTRPLLKMEMDKDVIVEPNGLGEHGDRKTIVKIPNARAAPFPINSVYDQRACAYSASAKERDEKDILVEAAKALGEASTLRARPSSRYQIDLYSF